MALIAYANQRWVDVREWRRKAILRLDRLAGGHEVCHAYSSMYGLVLDRLGTGSELADCRV